MATNPRGRVSSSGAKGNGVLIGLTWPRCQGENLVKTSAPTTLALTSVASAGPFAMIAQLSRLLLCSLLVVAIFLTTCCSSEDRKEYAKPRALRPRVVSSLSQAQLLDMPSISAVIVALTFLLLLLPLRILKFTPTTIQASRRKDVPSSVSVSLMEEAAQLTRKILDAVEKNDACVNHTACDFAAEVKKLGARQEIVFSILEILLPERWKASVAVMREAASAKQPKEFCLQFSCENNEVNPQPATPTEENNSATDESGTVDWVAAE